MKSAKYRLCVFIVTVLITSRHPFLTHRHFALADDKDFVNQIGVFEYNPEHFVAAKDELLTSQESIDVERFYEVAEKFQLKSADRTALWKEVAAAQHSSISKNELCAITRSKRQSIKSILCTYRIGNNVYKYALLNNNAYYEWDEDQNGRSHGLRSVNSKDFRTVVFPSDQDVNASLVNASISPLREEYSAIGLCNESPLFQCMLEDTNAFGSKHWGLDICNYVESFPLACVFEKTEILDGHHCIVLADLYTKIYLDIDKDYSLYALLDYQVADNNEENPDTTFSRRLDSSRVLHNLKDYGNGIWLPEWVETKTFNLDGSVNSENRITYEEIRLNSGLKASFFENVIPEGAVVADSVRDMVYIWGDHASIGSLIKETVKTKRQTIFRNFSVVLGLCLIACWGIIEWRKRRLQKGEVE